VNYYQLIIGIGAWLGTLMLFNVWALIWPSQKKVLGLVPPATRKKPRPKGRDARLADQFRAVHPDAVCMGSATHGLPL